MVHHVQMANCDSEMARKINRSAIKYTKFKSLRYANFNYVPRYARM